jgi:hypothetical protein
MKNYIYKNNQKGIESMQIKVKKSYTYKEVCKIRDKAMEYGVKAYQKYISDHNKYMIAWNKKWAEQRGTDLDY